MIEFKENKRLVMNLSKHKGGEFYADRICFFGLFADTAHACA